MTPQFPIPKKIKVYIALLLQTGTAAPTATILQNTYNGTPVWTRVGVGDYQATLTGEFKDGKTIFYPMASYNGDLYTRVDNLTTAYVGCSVVNDDKIDVSWYTDLTSYTPIEQVTVISANKFLIQIITFE